MSKRENAIETYLVKYAKSKGYNAIKLEGPTGWPDRAIFYGDGQTAYAECKRPKGGKAGPLQAETLSWLRSQGHQAGFVSTKREAELFINSLDCRNCFGIGRVDCCPDDDCQCEGPMTTWCDQCYAGLDQIRLDDAEETFKKGTNANN